MDWLDIAGAKHIVSFCEFTFAISLRGTETRWAIRCYLFCVIWIESTICSCSYIVVTYSNCLIIVTIVWRLLFHVPYVFWVIIIVCTWWIWFFSWDVIFKRCNYYARFFICLFFCLVLVFYVLPLLHFFILH